MLVLAACSRSDRIAPAPGVAPVPSAPRDAAVRDASTAIAVDDAFRLLSAGQPTPRTCFALSKNHHRAACATGTWIRHEHITLDITIVGEIGDLESTWTYVDREWRGEDDPRDGWAPPSDPAELARAHKALADRGYVPDALAEVRIGPHESATLGGWTIRRERRITVPERPYDPAIDRDELGNPAPEGGVQEQHAEHLDLRCGAGWVAIPIDPGHVYAGEGEHVLSLLTDHLLLVTASADYGTEGDYGGQRTAAAVDLSSLCARR